MNCARCKAQIPDDSVACPSCGLKLKRTPPVTLQGPYAGVPGQAPPPPGAHRPQQPHQQPPQPPPVQTYAPPSDVYAQAPLPPPAGFFYPGAPGGQWPPPQPSGQWSQPHPGRPAPGTGENAGNKTPVLVIAIVLAGLVLIGAAAGMYFLVLKQPGALSEPEAVIVKFFETVGSGDTETLASLFTPETRPGETELRAISLIYGSGGIEMKDVKTELVSESATDAEVKVKDFTIEMSGDTVKMSDVGMERTFDFKLKKVNGEWLIEGGGTTPFVPSFQPTTTPSGST